MTMTVQKFSRRCWFPIWLVTAVAWCLLDAPVRAGTFEASSSRELGVMKRKIRAAQFLQRATFGPTIEQIDALAERMGQIGTKRACSEWIDRQMELPPSFHHPLAMSMYADDGYDGTEASVWIQRYRYHAWWHNAIAGEDQLRQRVAWALIQILVTSDAGAGFDDRNVGHHSELPRWLGPSKYYDLMVQHAFGSYRELLEDVTYSPIMGIYLSHLRNRKTDLDLNRFPDENYAREIMQLFTIGLYELHQDGRLKKDAEGNLIPTYDNETIKEFAKIFTGLSFKPHPNASSLNSQFGWGNDFEYPMQMFDHEHEPGPKTLLGGEVIGSFTEAVDGERDIAAALDNLMAHENVGPFISRRLIQRLVKSNPSRAYIRRVTRVFNNNGRGVKGDLKAVVKAILLDPECWRGQRLLRRSNPLRVEVVTRGTDFSSLSEPVIRFTRLLRGVHATSDDAHGRMLVPLLTWIWVQGPYKQPTVFSFFLPDYQPPGELVGYQPSRRIPNGFLTAPEFQQKTAVTSNNLINHYRWGLGSQGFHYRDASINYDVKINMNVDWEMSLVVDDDDIPKLIDHVDLVFCAGSLPQGYKDKLADLIIQKTAWQRNDPTWGYRFEADRFESVYAPILTSPFCAITE